VNGQTGIVVLKITDIDLLGNQFFTNALAQAAISVTTPITYSAGVIGHANSGATANTYGSSTLVPQLTIDAKGHVTAIANVALSSVVIGPDLTAIEALTGTGYLIRTASNTWALRSLTGSSGRVALTYPDGVTGPTVIDLVASGVSAGTYGSAAMIPQVTFDIYGRATSATNIPVPATIIPAHTHTLGNLSNVNDAADAPTTNYYLKWSGSEWVAAAGALLTLELGTLTTTSPCLVATTDGDGAIDTNNPSNKLIRLVDSAGIGHVQMSTTIYVEATTAEVAAVLSGIYYYELQVGTIPSNFRPTHNINVPLAGLFKAGKYWNSVHTIQMTGNIIFPYSTVLIKPNGNVYVTWVVDGATTATMASGAVLRPYVFPIIASWLNSN
jgi:hypothetical protein